jgi:hypothetical protein
MKPCVFFESEVADSSTFYTLSRVRPQMLGAFIFWQHSTGVALVLLPF